MGYEMSSEFHERTRLMAVAQWIGQWAWVLAPWLWIFLYDPDWFESAAEQNVVSLGGWSLYGVCSCPAIFCRSTTGVGDKLKLGNVDGLLDTVKDFISGIIITFKNKPFQKICIATFFIFNSFQTIAAFSWFIIVYYMNNGDTAQAGVWPTLFGSVMSLCTCFLVIPVVNGMAQKYGKRYTFLFTQSISLFGYILLWWCFSPKNPWMIFIPLPLIAFGIGGLFTLMMSMTADICDLDELETGEASRGHLWCYLLVDG